MPIISPNSPANMRGFQTLEEVQALKPVWLRVPAASRVSGLSRSRIFLGVTKGTIKSKHLKGPGKERGIRLINFDSLLAFVEAQES
jgi:hypothetical protein